MDLEDEIAKHDAKTEHKEQLKRCFERHIPPYDSMTKDQSLLYEQIASTVARKFEPIRPLTSRQPELGTNFFIWLDKIQPIVYQKLAYPGEDFLQDLWDEMRFQWDVTVQHTGCFAKTY
ncbi:hypothetical protein NW762_012540 [Fusarium torreyae]|uniref:Uncharacterized protein n=1 Tax=Fusarium torreyae TaxID=1237075 RepID=A0A9W8V8J0_9HYPO|nr:hypothetical protein NW762_012540 [Fusarium torreyae]